MQLKKDHRLHNPLNILEASVMLGIMIGLEILIYAGLYDFGFRFESGDPRTSIISVLANGVLFTFVMHHTKLSYTSLFHPSNSKVSRTLALLAVPIIFVIAGTFGWLSDITNVIISIFPEDKVSLTMLYNMMDGGVISIISICVIAPFLEEMLFRGIILRSFLAHYSPAKAIVASSVLFALIHLNIYQIPGAFIIGCFLGWVYYKSRSLWPCIYAHAVNNAAAYYFFANEQEYESGSLIISLMSFLVSMLGLYLLHKIFDLAKVRIHAA
jgi:membrane protease YdiL (CAAX protease family)